MVCSDAIVSVLFYRRATSHRSAIQASCTTCMLILLFDFLHESHVNKISIIIDCYNYYKRHDGQYAILKILKKKKVYLQLESWIRTNDYNYIIVTYVIRIIIYFMDYYFDVLFIGLYLKKEKRRHNYMK